MAHLTLTNVHQCYGDRPILRGVSWSLTGGQTGVVLGASGSGKTTLLRSIAGLTPIKSGSIAIDSRDVTNVVAHRRGVAMGFQNDRLYPHQSIKRMLVESARCGGDKDPRSTAKHIADRLGVADHWHRLPDAISGGQRQRISVAKAILRRTPVCLFDEPLASNDVGRRESEMQWLRSVAHEMAQDRVWVLVTHDGDAALRLADQLAVMRVGKLVQIDSPEVIYQKPLFRSVAEAIGSPLVNWIDRHQCPVGWESILGDSDGLAIRPHNVRLQEQTPMAGDDQLATRVVIETVRTIDRGTLVEARNSGDSSYCWRVLVHEGGYVPAIGQVVALMVKREQIHSLPDDVTPT
ncbi:MAG: ABC transporter ATP-binding protein [Planctomycetota bacterium]